MWFCMEVGKRLRAAREAAGFRSAASAAEHYGWTASTYASHENGSRGMKLPEIEKYARAFRVDPSQLAFGGSGAKQKVAGVTEQTLETVIAFALSHEGVRQAPASEVTDLILDLCKYVTQSGDAGLANIVDFEVARREMRAG